MVGARNRRAWRFVLEEGGGAVSNKKGIIEVCDKCGANLTCPECGISHKGNTFWCYDCSNENKEKLQAENAGLPEQGAI
jgi:hypothetical protein